jgi:hypothetical protein
MGNGVNPDQLTRDAKEPPKLESEGTHGVTLYSAGDWAQASQTRT